MTHLAEVVTIYEANARSIPDMLRQSADSIETEVEGGFSPTVAMVAVQVAENGAIQVYGWGDTNTLQALGTLHLGALKIADMILDDGQ